MWGERGVKRTFVDSRDVDARKGEMQNGHETVALSTPRRSQGICWFNNLG